ncbi:monoamine oxidase N [Cordyceps militaris CM01]|uniref:Amine oxidase n=1 Tax=Cordyceps militaris (strain CM01) TaxID=983644 RepID=G3JRP2_CORMM|nr:monoamine oxidase N [Cordyceps militaris CM01]EGX88432.1 monoamine oxidase N [Cordyceps militaris CM01]
MVYTTDGFTWTPSAGRRNGLPTIGVVQPPEYSIQPDDDVHDVIVIGAGYAGLIAARDLTTQGKTTLLLEARDRLGGRTWNATINGFHYEVGGTWIHWHMPHIYRENPGSKEDYFTATTGHEQRNMSHEEEADIAGRVLRIFCNLDGDDLKHAWQYPLGTTQPSAALLAQWDQRSCQDRLDEVHDRLSAEERSVLEAQLLQMGGGRSLDRIGLLGALQWWALGGHTPTGLNDTALHTRLRSGQSALHRRVFAHAASTGRLSHRFCAPVRRVEDRGDLVAVTLRDGRVCTARAVICTVPLNVLAGVEFVPELPPDKAAAVRHRSVNRCIKVHVDVNGPDWLSWSALGTPGRGLVSAFGDHLTNAGNSHLVCFGPDPEAPAGISLGDVEAVQAAVTHLLPKDKQAGVIINRIVSHDWNKDEFSNGTWCFMGPEATSKYLSALQRPHGNILFASADWSNGWRGWIDGAVQSGMEAARALTQTKDVSGHGVFGTSKMTNGVK